MGQPCFAYKETWELLSLFSINIHHNTPKTPSLKFSIRGNIDRFLKNACLGRDFQGLLSKISFSCTASSTVNIKTQLLMWITSKDVEMVYNCICNDIMNGFWKILENGCSKGKNSFSAHPTLSRKTLSGEFVLVPISFLGY